MAPSTCCAGRDDYSRSSNAFLPTADTRDARWRSRLVIARNERLEDEDGAVETTRVWITEAGKRVLAARG